MMRNRHIPHTYIRDKLIALLDKNSNKTILDIGCGNGALANFLIKKGYNVYGTDASEEDIIIANNINPGRFVLQDLPSDDLPTLLEKLSFDTVISTEVIEHLYDPRKFIDFTKRTLMKNGGGEIILSTTYHGYWRYLAPKMDAHLSPLWDSVHIKFWSKKSLTILLEEEGFTVTDFKGCGRFLYLWMSMLIKASI